MKVEDLNEALYQYVRAHGVAAHRIEMPRADWHLICHDPDVRNVIAITGPGQQSLFGVPVDIVDGGPFRLIGEHGPT